MRILVIGGICGLGAALLLARDGHNVTVLERAGASRFHLVNPLPPFFTDRAPRLIDEKLWTLTARRPVGEWVFASAAQNARRLSIQRGAAGDRDTWSVAIFLATGDQPLKNLRHDGQWMKAIRACPLQAQWACTNPSAGRGLTVGFLHELRLRDALREGREPTPPANDLARRFGALMASIAANPDLFRDALEHIGTVTPLQEILERPAVIQRLAAAREALKDTPRPPIPGPTRSQLIQIAS